ncbi:eamA-like transporter family protein [Pseudomonas fluorescens]|uniref:EamA-like transporter family protein n=1 Tax=Pseudomonas fluorescens TaxID=294 RepID=A0A0P8X4D5_PSEFL|nr:hypothetical protein [Pseudomonas fluorescens]KPU60902.1 eamA-like transporter family protein [Pseudomonas fluorescens]
MSSPRVDHSLQGIGLCTLGYAFLALQDAVIKWLVADYSVVTILFWRSLVGGIGQFLLFASFRRATATLLAPFEYTGLIAVSGTLAMIFGRHSSQDVVGAECSVTQPLYPATADMEPVGGAESLGVEAPLEPETVEHRR